MTPSIWSLLAFARREFENAFSAPSLSDTPVHPQTTSQTTDGAHAGPDRLPRRSRRHSGPHHTRPEPLRRRRRSALLPRLAGRQEGHRRDDRHRHGQRHRRPPRRRSLTSRPSPASPLAQWFSRASPVAPDAPRSARWRCLPDGPPTTAQHGTRSTPTCSPPPTHSTSTWKASPALAIRSALAVPSPASRSFDLKREPQLFVGGDGSSDDNNNGTAFPAIPFGGDIFGPQPCTAPDRSLLFPGNFFQAVGAVPDVADSSAT